MLSTRQSVVLLLVSMTALAGCVTPLGDTVTGATLEPGEVPLVGQAGTLHLPGGVPVAPGALSLAFGGQYSTGVPAVEPTGGITSDGALFMTGYGTGGATGRPHPTIMRSVDQGQTWEDVGPKLPTGDGNPPVTNDPYVYVDPATDRVYDIDLLGTVCSYLSWSDDQGASWTTNPFACGTPFVNDHQTIVAAEPRALPTVGYPNILYYCVNRVADSACATSLDGGRTFTPLKTVWTGVQPTQLSPEGDGFCGGLHGHLTAGPDGKVFLPRSLCGPAVVAITEDDGLTWSTYTIDTEHPVDGHEVRIAVDEDNNVYATWPSMDGLIYFSRSVDGGKTWSPAKMIVAPGVTATMFNAIVAGGPGKVAFAYVGSTIEGGYEGKETGNGGLMGDILGQPETDDWDNATWNAYIGVMTDALADDPVILTVTANDPADPLARGLCGRTRCNGMTDFIDIDLDPAGRPWATFVDVCTEECVTDREVHYDRNVGFMGTLVSGPALIADGTVLPVLQSPPAKAE